MPPIHHAYPSLSIHDQLYGHVLTLIYTAQATLFQNTMRSQASA